MAGWRDHYKLEIMDLLRFFLRPWSSRNTKMLRLNNITFFVFWALFGPTAQLAISLLQLVGKSQLLIVPDFLDNNNGGQQNH